MFQYTTTHEGTMILILEGPDGAGKSTLKKQLQARFDFVESVPKSLPTHKSIQTMCAENATAINLSLYSDCDVIFDRGWMSEAIYSPILRRTPGRFTKVHERMFERMALSTGVTVVYCNPGREKIISNLSTRGDEFIRELSVLEQIINSYKKFEYLTGLNVVEYNYTQDSFDWLCEAIWDEKQGGHTGRTIFGNGYADTLIVSLPSQVTGSVPMISWNEDSIAWRLTESLEAFGLDESDLAWTTSTGPQLRNLVVSNHYKRVAYISAELALDVERSLDGLNLDVRYIPLSASVVNIGNYLNGWELP
jgi:hypothetical protein